MKYTKRMTFVLSFYGQIAIIFPIMVAAPRYFAGAFTFGVLMQIIVGVRYGQRFVFLVHQQLFDVGRMARHGESSA